MLRITLFLFSLFLSGIAVADTYPGVPIWYYGGQSFSSLEAACVYSISSNNAYVYQSSSEPSSCNLLYYGNPTTSTINRYYTCPYGGDDSGSNCINVPPCTAPATRDSTGECKLPRVCSSTEYNLNDVCTPIPDCNSGSETGGNFFNKTTKSCQSVPSPTICISDKNTKYCPPIDDCKPSSYICSDDPTIVGEAAATRAAEIASAKSKADAAKSEIVTIKLQSEAAASEKLAAAQAAKAAKDAAKTASDAALSTGVPATIKSAIESYNKFAQDYIDSLARSANSEAAKEKVKDIDIETDAYVAEIPVSNPGNSDALKTKVEDGLNRSIKVLVDVVSGDGNGNGPGSGIGTSTSPSVDTSKLGKDSTLHEISDKLSGGTPGSFAAGPDSFYTSEYPGGIGQVWADHKAALMQTSFVSAVSGLTPQIGGAGTCPSWSFPTLSGGSMELQPPCEIWPLLRLIFIITALFTARSLVFGG